MSRTLNVVKMQLVNRETLVWVPLLVLGGAFVLTYAVYAIVRSAGADGPLVGGGAQAPLWYFLVVGIQSLTLTFPFSQAMSVTRREFYTGSLLAALGGSALLAVVFVVIGLVEDATDGFGLGGVFARLPGLWDEGIPLAFAFYLVMAMLAFVTGFLAATVFKRFGTLWLVVGLLAVAAVLVLAVWLITSTGSWGSVGRWIVGQGWAGMVGWGALLVVVLAGLAYLPLRRTVP
ncbi:hypothetical protein EDD28_1940 [Salana multivorans]|uniref:Uncharacterized protein n=1 Tax=Salana multivorans TaxID=120377 RepID=A0A3N2DCA8_9MICO|nr:hypothetical protein [Salana multivorans]MBN8883309.1 hypothetical protein [Salana multivorans]OJX97749.1 MAG: hypothetical protein BGO96_12475 [Micrococcales bacterium 73-15]ROR97342.1 hypothetical protein EDD28_1940 [Salana multivorans]